MNGKLTIVIPAFNEEANIEPMARETLRVCRDAEIPCWRRCCSSPSPSTSSGS